MYVSWLSHGCLQLAGVISHVCLQLAGVISHVCLQLAGVISHGCLQLAGVISHGCLQLAGVISHGCLQLAGVISHVCLHGYLFHGFSPNVRKGKQVSWCFMPSQPSLQGYMPLLQTTFFRMNTVGMMPFTGSSFKQVPMGQYVVETTADYTTGYLHLTAFMTCIRPLTGYDNKDCPTARGR